MSGYIGTQPVPQATQTRDSFTATSGQTSFATGGYTPNFLDVYLNGVKLAAADYTATNGSDVVLASGAATGDILEVVAFTTFTPASIPDGTPSIDDNGNATAITIDSSERVLIGKTSNDNSAGISLRGDGEGYFVRDGAGVLTINRLSSDGDIVNFYKDTSPVGSIGTVSDSTFISGRYAGLLVNYYDATNSVFNPVSTAGVDRNGLDDLGYASSRFRDLYLSGGVYLGGTGSANKLDDYEEGTWTPSSSGIYGFTAGGSAVYSGNYVKIGDLVHVNCSLNFDTSETLALGDRFVLQGIPFVMTGNKNGVGGGSFIQPGSFSSGTHAVGTVASNSQSQDEIMCVVTRVNGTPPALNNTNVNCSITYRLTNTFS
jgi:hypothetical protein